VSECTHEFLMRHDYEGEVFWQCDQGCDFVFREGEIVKLRNRISDELARLLLAHDVDGSSFDFISAIRLYARDLEGEHDMSEPVCPICKGVGILYGATDSCPDCHGTGKL
jgi:hypothetical protein